jgi:hypothetical protein
MFVLVGLKKSAPRRMGTEQRVLEPFARSSGLLAGSFAAFWLATLTLVDRLATVPFLYGGVGDGILHVALEFVAGTAIWVTGWLALRLGTALSRPLSLAGRAAVHVATAWLGVALGSSLCIATVRYSSYWPHLSPSAWWVTWSVLGTAMVVVGRRLLARPIPENARLLGGLIAAAGAALHWFALHHPLRHYYGNLHALAQVTALFAAGIGCVLAASRRSQRLGLIAIAVAAALAGSVTSIVGTTPTFSLRRAVLVEGGVGKVVILKVLWPLADRDRHALRPLSSGVDPTSNASLESGTTTNPEPQAPLDQPFAIAPNHERRLHLLWIVVDSARTDSFERLLRDDATIARGFSDFAFYPEYSSCSSRTHLVMAQLLDAARCDARSLGELGPGTLLEVLRRQGYQDELFGYYPTKVAFQRHTHVADDGRLIALAREAIKVRQREAKAVFVHLKAGHAEYVGPGNTERERYEHQLAASFDAVAELAREAAKDDYTVIVIGDHGEAFGEHRSEAHASNLYEEVLRTPLLVRSPNVAPGRHPRPLGCPDVAWKTLFALGILESEPPALEYQFAALEPPRERSTRAHGASSLRTLRAGSKKVVWSPFLGIWEAYDLERDPLELNSVVETRESDFASLRSKLEALTRSCPPPDHNAIRPGPSVLKVSSH